MSEKYQIDELFRRKLDGKGLEYSGEHWEHMESLLSKKKGKFLKTAAWFATVLLLAVLTFYLTKKDEKPESISATETSPVLIKKTPTVEDIQKEYKSNENNLNKNTIAAPETVFLEMTEKPENTEQITGLLHDDLESKPAAYNKPDQNKSTIPVFAKKDEIVKNIAAQNEDDPISQDIAIMKMKPEMDIEFIETENSEKQIPKIAQLPENLSGHYRTPFTHLYVAPFFNYGKVHHRFNQSVDSWKASREETQAYHNYGIDVRIARKRLSLTTGLGVMQWIERTNYNTNVDHYTFDTTLRLVSREFVMRPDGSYAALIGNKVDTLSHTTTDTVYCTDCQVKFNYVTIPLVVQYEFGRAKWHYFSRLGLSFSFLRQTNGEYSLNRQILDDGSEGMRTGDPGEGYISNTFVQADLRLGIKYRIHPLLSVNGHIRYNRSINSMMRLYSQQPDFYGIGLGMEWKIY